MEIIFVTGNKGKVKAAMSHIDPRIKLTCCDFLYDEPEVNDIEYISKHKALYAYEKTHKPCIANDSGFYIPCYPGNPNFPGAFPKRDLIEKIGIEGLLNNMKDVEDRYCYFKECLSYYDGTELKTFECITEGTLSHEILGSDSEHKWSELWFVFIPKGCTKTLSQMTDEERSNRKKNIGSFEQFSCWYIDSLKRETKLVKKTR